MKHNTTIAATNKKKREPNNHIQPSDIENDVIITKTIPNARAFEKRFICKVDEYCDIFTKIEEGTNETKLYGYLDTPISTLEYEIQQLKTATNQKFARRLYCGKIWTHNGLCFTKRYYGIDN